MKYNVSKREAKKLGIKRVPVGGSSSSSSGSYSTGSYDPSTMKKLQKKYMGMMEPTKAERKTAKQLENVIESRELGLQHEGERPVEMGFITGAQKAITDRAARQAIPLQTRLAQAQAKRAARAQALAGATGIERAIQSGSLAERQFDWRKQMQEEANQLARDRFSASQARSSAASGPAINSSFWGNTPVNFTPTQTVAPKPSAPYDWRMRIPYGTPTSR